MLSKKETENLFKQKKLGLEIITNEDIVLYSDNERCVIPHHKTLIVIELNFKRHLALVSVDKENSYCIDLRDNLHNFLRI